MLHVNSFFAINFVYINIQNISEKNKEKDPGLYKILYKTRG